MPLDDVDNVVSIAAAYPLMFETTHLSNALESAKELARKESSYDKYVKIACYDENIAKLADPTALEESSLEFNQLYTRYDNLTFACEAIKEALASYSESVVVEADDSEQPKKKGISALTKLKLAAENIKKGIQKGVDIDRNVSRRIDMSMDTLAKNYDRALASSNREAVIKGTILPSASKVLHIAIASGAAWLVNPALAVIGLLGYIGASVKHRKKERQMIMDEIEVELNMCDRYIRLAEEKNDMKAVRSLLQTKRALEKQRGLLKYHANIELGKPVYSNTGKPDDSD